MSKAKRIKLTDQLRAMVRDSGHTAYRIAKETGVSNATLSRFLSGERFLSAEALDALAEFLDVELRPRGRKQS